jgi:hypothetical protein
VTLLDTAGARRLLLAHRLQKRAGAVFKVLLGEGNEHATSPIALPAQNRRVASAPAL